MKLTRTRSGNTRTPRRGITRMFNDLYTLKILRKLTTNNG